MGRRKSGRDIDGWLVIDKPEGPTSTQIVGKARWALDARKAGHAGTLDPLATGVVAIALGEATKTVAHAQEGLKRYRFTARWGAATTTDDREGAVCAKSDARPSRDGIEAILPAFTGAIRQVPPAFSAIRVDGARAYDLARRGETPEMKPRPINIESLRLIDRPDVDHAVFEMVCGKGGYVRSMARDLGEALGTRAHVVQLRRLSSGGFAVAEALDLPALEALRGEDPGAALLPVEAGLAGLARMDVDPAAAERLRNGAAAGLENAPAGVDAFWVACQGAPVAICGREGGRAVIRRVFNLSPQGGRSFNRREDAS